MSNETLILTGASGFIGSNLTISLINKGFDVHIISRPKSDLGALKKYKDNYSNHLYDGSIKNLKKIFNKVNPKYVIHLASLFLAEHDDSNITNLLESNVIFSTHIVEAMTSSNVKYLINTGTSWQHYKNNDYNPVNLYAATKQSYETILEFYIQTKNIRVITLKLFDTYGSNDPRPKLIPFLKKISLKNDELDMSEGNQLIDIVHIDDVISAYHIAIDRILSGNTSCHEKYAISSGNPISLKKLVSIYEKVNGINLKINWGLREYRNREVMIPWNNYESLPGWSPQVKLIDGLKALV